MKVKFWNTLILILTCFCAGQAFAQSPPKEVWNQIEVKARDLKLGSPRPESPEPRQTPLPRNQGWWQALTTNRVEPNISVPAPGPTSTQDKRPFDRSRGLFRVTINNFSVEHVVHDGAFDAGDDAFLMWDAQEFNADGRLVGSPRSGQSLVYGDSGRNRAQIQAGTQGDNGGLRAGDKITGRSAPSANRLPMLVGDFELVDGENAFVFAPTIWVAENNVGDNARLFRQRFQSRTRFAAYDVRQFLERNNAQFHWTYSLSRGGDDWFDMRFYSGLTINEDRPIGSARAFNNCPEITGILILDFIPHAFLLTYKSVTDFMQSAGGQHEVPFEAQYRGTGGGIYAIAMTIERVK